MVIGIFTDTYEPDLNGVATATKVLRDTLTSHGHKVIVITTGLPHQKDFSFQNGVRRIPGVVLSFLYGYRRSWIYNSAAYKELAKIHFDVFHIQQEFGISIFGRICASLFHVPLVYTYHTSYPDYSGYLSGGKKIPDALVKKTIVSVIKKITARRGEIITPSKKSLHLLESYGLRRFVNVIPNALNLTPFNKEKDLEREKDFRKAHDLEGKRILLYLGRISEEKNIQELLEGFCLYKTRYQDEKTVLLLVGSGPHLDQYKVEAATLPFAKDILFYGPVPHDDTCFFYQLCDAFINASTSETQGLTYNEARASKAIVIAHYDNNLTDLIKDGETGFFFDDRDSRAEKIDFVLTRTEEEKEARAEKAKEENAFFCSPERFYKKIIHVYEKAIRHQY